MSMQESRRGRRSAWASLVAAAPLAGLVPFALMPPANAATVPVTCGSGACTVAFASPGVGQSFPAPAGVSSMAVTLYGGVGGTNYDGDVQGGAGAKVTAGLAVTAGQSLGVDIGGAGAGGTPFNHAGGVNGGGSALYSGAGGGASDLTLAGTRLLVAGGGGGAGIGASNQGAGNCGVLAAAGGAGGDADTVGDSGESADVGGLIVGEGGGGSPGTTTAAGTGGVGGTVSGASTCDSTLSVSSGAAGAAGSGGTGGIGSESAGGGGGGGWFGGGAGGGGAGGSSVDGPINAGYGGGGGGSSYTGGAGVTGATVTDHGNTGTVNDGNGEATFTYTDPISTGAPAYQTPAGTALTVPAASGLLGSAAGTSGPSGDDLTASGSANGSTAQGGTVTVNADGSFDYTPPSGFSGRDTFGYRVGDGVDYATGAATIEVQQSDTTPPVSTLAATHGSIPRYWPTIAVRGHAEFENSSGSVVGTVKHIRCWDSHGVKLTLSATDAGSGVASLSYSATGAGAFPVKTATSLPVKLDVTANGLTTLDYHATDRAGNVEQTSEQSMLVAGTLSCTVPTPSFTIPSRGTAIIAGTVTIAGHRFPYSTRIRY